MSLPKCLGPLVIVLLLAGLGLLTAFAIAPFHKVYGATDNISLVGYYLTGWNNTPANPTITIMVGDTVSITTSAGDGFQHRFFVDVDGGGMIPNCSVDKCAMVIPPTSTDPLTGFTAGTYTYYCQYHTAMQGTFIVQAPTPDFSITPNPSSLTLNPGNSGTVSITITSQGGFTGNVNLTGTISPSGPTLSFNPVTVSLASGGSATSTLTVATSSGLYSSTPTGSYTVTVTGSGNPSLAHSTTVSVTVTSTSSPAGTSIPPSVLAIAGFGILAVAIVVGYLVLRRRSGRQPKDSR